MRAPQSPHHPPNIRAGIASSGNNGLEAAYPSKQTVPSGTPLGMSEANANLMGARWVTVPAVSQYTGMRAGEVQRLISSEMKSWHWNLERQWSFSNLSRLSANEADRPVWCYHIGLFFYLKISFTLMDMALSWALKRRIAVLSFVGAVFAILVALVLYSTYESPSCFDAKQNQDEEEVDCGGDSCVPCASKIKEPHILWTRFFSLKDGYVDVAAMIENPNQFLMARELVYAFKIYDSKNVLIATRENKTFLDPGEKIILLESEISIQNRSPQRAVIELRGAAWDKAEQNIVRIKVMRADPLLATEFPRIEARIKNESPQAYRNIEVDAVLWSDDQAVGTSRTLVDHLDINQEKDLVFTWPKAITGVGRVEIFFRQLK